MSVAADVRIDVAGRNTAVPIFDDGCADIALSHRPPGHLQHPLKRNPRTLAAIAVGILVMRLVDDFWVVVPGIPEARGFHWLWVTTPVALGGLWTAAFLSRLRGVPLVPGNEPLVEHAMAVHGH